MRKNLTHTTLLMAALAAFTGCQATGTSPKMSFWPFHKKEKPADSALAAGPPPAWPTKPSTTAAPSSTPTGAGSVAATSAPQASPAVAATAAPYSYPTTPASYPPAGGPVVEYGTPVDASPYAANANYTAVPRVTSNLAGTPGVQTGRYDANAYAGAATNYPTTRPAGYETPASAAPPAARYNAAPVQPQSPPAGRYDSYPDATSTGDRYGSPAGSSTAANYDPYSAPGSYETPTADAPYATTQDNRYQPGQSDYKPGQTDYAPPGVARYDSPAAPYESPAQPYKADMASDPHYRPGSTTDYVGSKPAVKPAPATATKPTTTTSRYGTTAPAGMPQANPYAAPVPGGVPAGYR